MSYLVKTFDGQEMSQQKLSRKPRCFYLRAGYRIGVLPDGRELVEIDKQWVWLLNGATEENIKTYIGR